MVSKRIRDWPLSERPMERLQSLGAGHLSHSELLAILVGSGDGASGRSAVDVARELMALGGSVSGVERLSFEDLCAVAGVGPVKASRLQAAFELARRLGEHQDGRLQRFHSSAAVARYLTPLLQRQQREHFVVLLLDSQNRLLRHETISVGTTNSVMLHPRDLFHAAVRYMATSVIVAHNHPGGDPQPSPEDERLTLRLQEVGEMLGLPVIDHLIIGEAGCYYSFADGQQFRLSAEISTSEDGEAVACDIL